MFDFHGNQLDILKGILVPKTLPISWLLICPLVRSE